MKILYIFPHPDDESFGPAVAIAKQKEEGHTLELLTLTKGEATKERLKYEHSLKEMGEIRYLEMLEMSKILELDKLTVLDLPDNQLKEIDPVELEMIIKDFILNSKPDVIVTYPVHGISGFHDHLVTHAVVKRVYCELKKNNDYHPKRLCFFTIDKSRAEKAGIHKLSFSTEKEIDVCIKIESRHKNKMKAALDCYKTYNEVIERSKVKEFISDSAYFEVFGEKFDPCLKSLTEGI